MKLRGAEEKVTKEVARKDRGVSLWVADHEIVPRCDSPAMFKSALETRERMDRRRWDGARTAGDAEKTASTTTFKSSSNKIRALWRSQEAVVTAERSSVSEMGSVQERPFLNTGDGLGLVKGSQVVREQ